MRPRNPAPPSHVTRAQASRILEIHPENVRRKACKGGELQSERWYGTDMVPMWRIVRYLDKMEARKGSADPAEQTLETRVAELEAGLHAVLGPDHLTEYECEHGTPLGEPCYSDCDLNPTRRALGYTGTLPYDAE